MFGSKGGYDFQFPEIEKVEFRVKKHRIKKLLHFIEQALDGDHIVHFEVIKLIEETLEFVQEYVMHNKKKAHMELCDVAQCLETVMRCRFVDGDLLDTSRKGMLIKNAKRGYYAKEVNEQILLMERYFSGLNIGGE